MVPLPSLWFSIILAPVLVFVASSLIWVVINYHMKDWAKLPNEDAVMDAIRAGKVPLGSYVFPGYHGLNARSPEFKEKMLRGPSGFVTIIDRGNMGKSMGLVFVYYLVVSFFVAYLASRTLAPGTEYLQVFRVVGTAAFLAYGFGQVPASIWFGKTWGATARDLIDAFIYAMLTAGAFAGFWPGS